MKRSVAWIAAVALAAAGVGCQSSAPVDELPMSHLSTDLGAETLKSPEKRHHMAWRAGETTHDPFLETQQVADSTGTSSALRTHRSRVPDPPVTIVPSSPDTPANPSADPWARFRPATSATYGTP
jgi:hypothetical protein